ncbi:MAG TPA: hypothetical protein VNW97_22795 [Candidatus Saccharimonadales bacterium]|nr:hypothetical protein [Candidatus Saccharimonadales bacterium]
MLEGWTEGISEYGSLMAQAFREFTAGHLLIVLAAMALGATAKSGKLRQLLDKLPESFREPARFFVLALLVLPIVTWGTYATKRAVRLEITQNVRIGVNRAFAATKSEIAATSESYPASRLITLSEGVGKITSRTYDLVRNTYSSSELRALSVFLYLGDDCDEKVLSGCVEDVIQDGELEKNRRYFPEDRSIVGATIKDGKRYYCPDLTMRPVPQSDCEKFQPQPPGMFLGFSSLLCYPVHFAKPVSKGSNPKAKPLGAVCLDSRKKHAFDGKEDDVWENMRDEMVVLAGVLYDFQQTRTSPALRKYLESDSAIKQTKDNRRQIVAGNHAQTKPQPH